MKKSFLRLFTSLTFFTLGSVSLSAVDYYVGSATTGGSPDGNVGDCTTPGNTTCTLQDAYSVAGSSDTIHITVPTVTYTSAYTTPCTISAGSIVSDNVNGSVIDFGAFTSTCIHGNPTVFDPGNITLTDVVLQNSNSGGNSIIINGITYTINGTSVDGGTEGFSNNTWIALQNTGSTLTFGATGDYTQPVSGSIGFLDRNHTLTITNNSSDTLTISADVVNFGEHRNLFLDIFATSGPINFTGLNTINAAVVQAGDVYFSAVDKTFDALNVNAGRAFASVNTGNFGVLVQGGEFHFAASFTFATGFQIRNTGDNIINDDGYNVTISGRIIRFGSNSGVVYAKYGSGVQALTNNTNTLPAGFNIYEGALSISNPLQVGSGPLAVSGGTLFASSGITLTNAFTVTAATSGGLSAAASTTFIVQSPLAGSGTLTIGTYNTYLTASGTVQLANPTPGTNTFSGPIVVGALNGSVSYPATLSIAALDLMGSPSALTLQGGGVFNTTATLSTLTLPITVSTGGGTLSPSSGTTLTVPESIASSGTGSITLSIDGGGTVILSGDNSSFAGNMSVISSSTLSVGATNNLGVDSSSYTLTLNAGTLAVTGNTTSARGFGLTGSNTIALGSNSLSLTGTATVASSSSLTKTGTGTLSVLPSSAGTGNPFTLSVSAGDVISNTDFLNGASITVAGGSTVEFDQTATGTFSDSITGSGAVSITGSALLTFNPATHSYSGGTSLSGPVSISGDVFGSSGSTLTSNGGEVETGSSFSLTNQVSLTGNLTIDVVTSPILFQLAGDISGAGGLIKTGDGTLLLTGSTNNYSGGTTINAGNLEVEAAGKLGTSTVTISGGVLEAAGTFTDTNTISLAASNGTIQVDSGTYTLSGDIGGAASLTKTGSGTLELSAVESYTGDTIVSEGTLALSGSGSIISSPAVSILSGSAIDISGTGSGATLNELSGAGNIELGSKILTVHETSDGTFSGAISGLLGTLIKTGSGTLVLSGVSTYTGKTYVNEGILEVNGDISLSPDPIVAAGATLSGIGSVGSTIVEASGTIMGGNPLGTLTIIGDLTLQTGSIFETTITSTETSLVTVSGSVTITDATYRLTVTPGSYPLSGTRVVLVGEGGVTGEFATILVNENLPSSAFVKLTYTATEVLLGFQPSLLLFAVGENAVQVANTLDAAPAELSEIVNTLIPLVTTKKRLTYGLNQLHPAQLKGMAISQENNAVRVRESITQRIMSELDSENCLSFYKKESEEKDHCDKNKKRITAWISGLGDTLKQNNKTNIYGPLSGYRSNTGGIVTGIDALFADHFYAGAIGAYTHSHLHFEDGKGEGDITSGYVGVYLSAIGSGNIGKIFYANASVIGSWSEYDVDRHIQYGKGFEKVNLTAKSDHGGNQILSHLDTGLNLNYFGFTIRPFDSFDYMSQIERGYAEHNAGQWELTITRKNAMMIRNELGVQFAKCLCFNSSKWIFSPKVSWVREVRIKGETFNVNFTGGGSPFVIHGYFPDRSLVAPGLAVTGYMLNDALLFDLYYRGEFKGGYSSNSYGGQIGYSF